MAEKYLYIIGNGFDLHHWKKTGTEPDTGYNYFGCYLKNRHPETFEWLVTTLYLSADPFLESDNHFKWSEFEKALAEYEPEEIWEKVRDFFDDDPHRGGAASWEAEKYIDCITSVMRNALNNFTITLERPENIECARLSVQKGALYISFNYTDTLERYYGVDASNIFYIHGKAGANADLIIGHGVKPECHENEQSVPLPPVDLIAEQTEIWYDEMDSQYSFSYNQAKLAIDEYWVKSFKDTQSIIVENESYFLKYDGVDNIIIMGHSLSDVDLPYFEEINKRVSQNAFWSASFHLDDEKDQIKKRLLELGIPDDRINMFQLQDALCNHSSGHLCKP